MSDLTWFHMFQVLMNILSTRGVLEQGTCLDALISIMLDSAANQMVDIVPALCLKFLLPLNDVVIQVLKLTCKNTLEMQVVLQTFGFRNVNMYIYLFFLSTMPAYFFCYMHI